MFDSDFGFGEENDDFCGIAFVPIADAFVQLDPTRGLDSDAVTNATVVRAAEESPRYTQKESTRVGLSASANQSLSVVFLPGAL